MSAPLDIIRRAQAVLAARGSGFKALATIAELDPRRDFIGAGLRNVQFGDDDLKGYVLRDADLSRAKGVTHSMVDGATIDATTKFPPRWQVSRLTHFWRDGCPSFVSAFGVDEFGQWFEFEIEGQDGAVTQRMRWIAPGKFLMGSPEGELGRRESEGPQHEVTIGVGFWMFDTACTQALWRAVMRNNPREFKEEELPVTNVSWNGARKFIAKISERVPGLNLSLPSEAQWEYACRAGTTTPFSLGEDITPDQVIYQGNFPYKSSKNHPVPAGSLPANPWGLYEMHGNVWEWCADAWRKSYVGAPADGSVWQSEKNDVGRVLRGGSYLSVPNNLRSANRHLNGPDFLYSDIGFRCARVQDGAEPAAARRVRRSGAERIAAAPSGEAARDINGHGVEIFPNGAPLILRGAGARRPVKPGWASASGRDEYGDWAEITVGKARQRLRLLKPGKFLMGSPDGEAGRSPDEGPQHEVEIEKAFWLFDTPCTQALWRAVTGKNPSRFKSADRPVERVSWDDTQAFIAKINERITGLNLSLPSEAQWEYACRAATPGMSYAGDFEILGKHNAPGLDAIAWYGGNSGDGFDLTNGHDSSNWNDKRYEHEKAGTRRVKQKQANAFGLYDMLGNVDEWCADAWHDDYEGAPTDGSVWESKEEAAGRVLRDGSWSHSARGVRSASRDRFDPAARDDDLGFRCARVQD